MDENTLQEYLSVLPLGPLRYIESTGSTNDLAMDWIEEGAPHLSLVVADEQTAGRGRNGSRWYTPPGSSLAFSLVLYPEQIGDFALPRLTGLGALGVCTTLQDEYSLEARIKWPNDVLVAGQKLTGVLVEIAWSGERLQSAVLGIGINVAIDSLPLDIELGHPATSVESQVGKPVERWTLLREVLLKLVFWLEKINSPEFLQVWEENLAYRDEMVKLTQDGRELYEGRLLGLDRDGALYLQGSDGSVQTIQDGGLQLRTVDSL